MPPEILIVDDAPFVAFDLEDAVFEAGFMALRPCGSVSGALALLDERMPDCAILDIHLADGEVFPVADRLRDAGIPVIFHSGASDISHVKARYPEAHFCPKPCWPKQLQETLRCAIRGNAQPVYKCGRIWGATESSCATSIESGGSRISQGSSRDEILPVSFARQNHAGFKPLNVFCPRPKLRETPRHPICVR